MTGDRYRRDDTPTQHQRMPRIAAAPSSTFIQLTCAQAGAVSRAQAIELALTPGQIEAMLAARRWQSYLPGVYLTFTGPVPPASRIWGALLYAGEGATANLETAAWLWGLRGDLPARIDMCVPHGRRVFDQPGLRIASRRHLAAKRHPVKLPARTRIEDTVLDLIDQTPRADAVVALLTGACQRRRTTAARLVGECVAGGDCVGAVWSATY